MILELKLKLVTGLSFFNSFLGRDVFFLSSGLTWASLKFWGNVLVSIEMWFMSVMGVINMSRQLFQHVCRNGIQITCFWRWAQNKLFNFIFWRTFKNVHFGSNFCFLHLWNILWFIRKFETDSFNFIHKIPREMITTWFYWCEFWQRRRWNSMHNVFYWVPKATGIVRIFWNNIS